MNLRKAKTMENETRKKKRNRIGNVAAIATVFVLTLLLATACSSGKGFKGRSIVNIEVTAPNVIKFDKYKSIYYKDLIMDVRIENFDPTKSVTHFFMDEFPMATKAHIMKYDEEKNAKLAPGELLISGSLKLSVKERNKIEDVKNEKGKGKSRQFVKVQHWDLKMEVIFTEGTEDGKGNEIFKKEFDEKLADADPESAQFNFENLFFKMTNRFTTRVTTIKRTQRRYLLQ